MYRKECKTTHPVGRITYWGKNKSFHCYRHKMGIKCSWAVYPSTHPEKRPFDEEGAAWLMQGLNVLTQTAHFALRPPEYVYD